METRIVLDALSPDSVSIKTERIVTVEGETFVLGSDSLGRDLFIRVVYGARVSLTVGVVAALVNMIIGILYGGASGYIGGMVDTVMMRIVDIISTIPLTVSLT